MTAPLLSVVMPAYNVGNWLDASLGSVLAQPVADLEVVLVDDGSTDATGVIAEEYAARDPRVRVIHQANAGVSAARNVGLEHAKGELVTFVDPDDVVPADAWGEMLTVLGQTGSDFALGMMERVDAVGVRSRPQLLARNHATERRHITVEEMPMVLADVFPCNKIFRMDFLRSAGLRFPEGIAYYEDNVFSAEAFLASRGFDVLTGLCYDWYSRGDLTSSTQSRGRIENLQDRVLTKQLSLDRIRAGSSDHVVDVFLRRIAPIDMWEHFRAAVAPGNAEPDRYWHLLRTGLLSLWNSGTVPFEVTAAPARQRLMGWLVAQDRRDDLARLIAEIDGPGLRIRDGRLLHPWHDDPRVPDVLGQVAEPQP